ncbi:MAG: hypothetical protein KIT83_14630 [Bryobacterales bacterium]|nr:hypothetical protein [Bryobacterales bacterium]
MMCFHGTRWMAVAAALTMFAAGAVAQRGSGGVRVGVDRPAMTATGSPVEGAERSSGVSGPSLGYLLDASTGDIHLVSGIAGSSLAGSGVHRKSPVRVAAISPGRDYAVVADEADDVVFYAESFVRGDEGIALWGDASRVTHAAVSPRGDRFALFAASSGRVAIYTVRDGDPGEAQVFQAGVPLESVSRLAVADVGDGVYLIAGSGAGSSVTRISADGVVRSLASLPGAVDLAFFAGSERALVLDAAQNALYQADFAEANPTLSLIASQADGIEQPLAMALSGDDRSVAIASASMRRAVVIDLASRASQQIELAEAPTGMRRMNARGVFQLTDARSAPALLLEVQPDGARTVYVPRSEGGRSASSGRAGLR